MNEYLFTLWKSVESGHVRVEDIANLLHLSPKQTARYIKSWEQDGWLTFISGRGRGNMSKIIWQKDVEETYEQELIRMMDEEPIEKCSKFLLWDWSLERKKQLMDQFQSKFGFKQNIYEIDQLIIPRRYPFTSLHPLDAVHVYLANLVWTVYNRLVALDKEGNVEPEIAHSWDRSTTKLRLYLRKDVKFHDGSILTADDVVYCLEKMRQHSEYANLWEPVSQIKAITPLVVDIEMPGGCSYILQLLGTITSSIYKETNNQLYGTGPFYVEENNEKKTKLSAFKEYFRERPLLDEIEFIQVPKDYDMIYTSNIKQESHETNVVESNSGFGVVIMNPCRNSSTSRQAVCDYIHKVIANHRHEVNQIDDKLYANPISCLSYRKEADPVPDVECPHFDQPVVIMQQNMNEKLTNWLITILEEAGVPIEIKWLSFNESIYGNTKHEEIDLYIHGEIFDMNEIFSFYYFLKNGYSPLEKILAGDSQLKKLLDSYVNTPFREWSALHVQMESLLIRKSLMIPLYTQKRELPFSKELKNIQLKHFGYVDFSKLWVRPNINNDNF